MGVAERSTVRVRAVVLHGDISIMWCVLRVLAFRSALEKSPHDDILYFHSTWLLAGNRILIDSGVIWYTYACSALSSYASKLNLSGGASALQVCDTRQAT